MMKVPVLVLSLTVLVAGCSNNSTGPKTNVNGSWTYTASNLAGAGLSCDVTDALLVLTQVGSTFSGTYSDAILTCSDGNRTVTEPPASGTIVSGQINGSSVTFSIDDSAYANTGAISGNSMNGTAVLNVNFGSGVVTLAGTWAAAKAN
jgi:hypothetical protein